MPLDQFNALVGEYYKDTQTALICTTVMNSSGNYKKVVTVGEFLGEKPDESAAESSNVLAQTLKAIASAKKAGKETR